MPSSVKNAETKSFDLEQVKQVDQLCDEFEDHWAGSEPLSIEDLISRVAPATRDLLFHELLVMQLQLTKDAPQIEDYLNRFPGRRQIVLKCFAEVLPPPEDSTPQPVDSRFRVIRMISKGGLGRIWQAEDLDLNREVALKDIRQSLAFEESSQRRFLQEAEITGRLEHPGIVPIYALGRHDNGQPYYVMRMIRGSTLSESIREFHAEQNRFLDTSCLAWRQLLSQFIDVCNTIHYAHSRGVLHRDIKPDNVMLGEFGETLVVDWGLAKVFHSENLETENGDSSNQQPDPADETTIAGTLRYMSPEQALGDASLQSPRSDVFSLGATLFCILTNRPPIKSLRSVVDVVDAIQRKSFPRPRQIRREIPRALEAICLKAISVDPHDRYQTAKQLAADVERWLASEPVTAIRESVPERLVRWRKRHRSLVRSISVSVALLLTVVLVAAIAWIRTPGQLVLRVNPAESVVRIDGRSHLANGQPLELNLQHGAHEIEVAAKDYFAEKLALMVRRGQSRHVDVRLQKHDGILNADCEPSGSEFVVDAKSYGARIRNLRLPVGNYIGVARKPGCIDSARIPFEISHGQISSLRVFLDSGLVWSYPSMGIQHDVYQVGDIDEDGTNDLLHNELGKLIVLSGRTGEPIQTMDYDGCYSFCLISPEKFGQILVVAQELDMFGDLSSPRIKMDVYELEAGMKLRWSKDYSCKTCSDQEFVAVIETADLNQDRFPDIGCSVRDGRVLAINAMNGELISETSLKDHQPAERLSLYTGSLPSADVLFGHRVISGSQTIGRVNLVTGELVWSRQFGSAPITNTADLDSDGVNDFVMGGNRIEVVSGAAGTSILRLDLANQVSPNVGMVRSDSDQPAWIVATGNQIQKLRPDGTLIWQRSGNVSQRQFSDRNGKLPQFEGHVLLNVDDSLKAIRLVDGAISWTVDGAVHGVICADWNGDGSHEIFIGKSDGLSCHESGGKRLWHLRFPYSVRPNAIVPDSDGDGYPEIIVVKNANLIARVRGPRILWQTRAKGMLLAQPQVSDFDADGDPDVIQLGPWGNNTTLGGLDGQTGRLIWTADINIPPNRAQAIADFDGDNRPELVSLGKLLDRDDEHLLVTDLSNGETLVRAKLDGDQSSYATPVVFDLNQDGIPDVVSIRWNRRDIIMIDGKSRKIQWRYETGSNNIGAPAIADIDADGQYEVIAPCGNGTVYVLQGNTGDLLWKTALGQSLRGKPVVADLDSDGHDEIMILGNVAIPKEPSRVKLFVLNDKGQLLWSFDNNPEQVTPAKTEASPALLRLKLGKPVGGASFDFDQTWVIAPLGKGGLVAIDADTRRPAWICNSGEFLSTPTLTDLDGDSRQELVLTTRDGRLLVLDALSGEVLVDLAFSDGEVTGSATVADLNLDGIKDLIVAGQDFLVTAIDGKTVQAARRHAELAKPRKSH